MSKRILHVVLYSFLVAVTLPSIGHPSDPLVQQREAIARIDAFIEYFRKTGDFKSRVGDLGAGGARSQFKP